MTIIKTLGPDTTDCYHAATVWAEKSKDSIGEARIKGYPQMEDIFADLEVGDYIVMPAGYTNRENSDFGSWVDYHYYYSDLLSVADLFPLDTMEMILVENTAYQLDRAIIHSSTVQLLKRNRLDCNGVDFSPSKSYALSLFNEMSYRYVICSASDYDKRRTQSEKAGDRIIERVVIKMIWVVYKVMKIN